MIKNKVIAFDLDDVICKRPSNLENLGIKKYKFCLPIKKNIKIINKLFDNGAIIRVYTARGMSYYNSDIIKIKNRNEFLGLTDEKLRNWVQHNFFR